MSLVCVCADVGASGQVLSTARGTLDAAGGQRGVRSTWQLKTYSCSHSCSKLVALIVICKVKNHIFLERNGARWHYNTLRLYFGYKFKLDRKYMIAISNEIAYHLLRSTITRCKQHDFISLYNS